jgi:CheY-like chemotaxis protein
MHGQTAILLVDDSVENAYFIHRAFQKAEIPCRLLIAMDPQHAMSCLIGNGNYSNPAEHPLPDLLLVDLESVDGRAGLLRWVRLCPVLDSLKIVVLTSSNHPSDINHSYTMGANSFVVKPTDFESLTELAHALHYWLHTTKPTRTPRNTSPTDEFTNHSCRAA